MWQQRFRGWNLSASPVLAVRCHDVSDCSHGDPHYDCAAPTLTPNPVGGMHVWDNCCKLLTIAKLIRQAPAGRTPHKQDSIRNRPFLGTAFAAAPPLPARSPMGNCNNNGIYVELAAGRSGPGRYQPGETVTGQVHLNIRAGPFLWVKSRKGVTNCRRAEEPLAT